MVAEFLRRVLGAMLRAERGPAPAAAGASEPQEPTAEELIATKARADARLEAAAIVVDVAIAQWRITPDMRAWAIEYAAGDPAGFAAFLVSAPLIHVCANGRALITAPFGADRTPVAPPDDAVERSSARILVRLLIEERAIDRATLIEFERLRRTSPRAAAHIVERAWRAIGEQLRGDALDERREVARIHVESAIGAGQLVPAQREWALRRATADLDGFLESLDVAAVTVLPVVPSSASAHARLN